MGMLKNEIFSRDVCLRHATEPLLFRWDHVKGEVHYRCIGCKEDHRVLPVTDKYFTDAMLMGDEISREEYDRIEERSK